MFVSTTSTEMLNKLSTGGVQINYRFTRRAHLYQPDMMVIELTFINTSGEDHGEIKIGAKQLGAGMSLHEFPGFNLAPDQTLSATLGVDFRDTTQAARFDIVIGNRPNSVSLQAPTGEMVKPVRMSENTFTKEQGKLRGMCEMRGKVELPSHACDTATICSRVYKAANLLQVPSAGPNIMQFAGKTLSLKNLVLVTILDAKEVVVNTENIVVGSNILKELTAGLEKA